MELSNTTLVHSESKWPLSNEISLEIFSYLNRLEDVWALMHTSSSLWKSFQINPVGIVSTALANGMPVTLLQVIKGVWDIRAGWEPSMTVEETQTGQFIDNRPFNTQVSQEFIRNFIELARKVHGMAHVILDDCLMNLGDIYDKLRPFPMLFPKIPGSQSVDPTPFLDPPSWEEEAILIQGLWLRDLHSLLTKAHSKKDSSKISAEREESGVRLNKAQLLHPENFLDGNWPGTFWTIFQGLAKMQFPRESESAAYCVEVNLLTVLDLTALLRAGGLDMAAACGAVVSLEEPIWDGSWEYRGILFLDFDGEFGGFQIIPGVSTRFMTTHRKLVDGLLACDSRPLVSCTDLLNGCAAFVSPTRRTIALNPIVMNVFTTIGCLCHEITAQWNQIIWSAPSSPWCLLTDDDTENSN